MANKTPLKANYTGGVVTSLAEFQSGDTIAANLIDPTGALTIGSQTIGSLAGFLFGTAGAVSGLLATARLKAITTTYDISTASGAIILTGAGFTPGAVIIFMSVDGGTAYSNCWGFDDGTNKMCCVDTRRIGSDFIQAYITVSYRMYQTDLTKGCYGNIWSFNSDGFTLSNTKVGSPTGTVAIMALCFR
jgi:hypothetical protein